MEKIFKTGIVLFVLGLIVAVTGFLNLVFSPPLAVPSASDASMVNGIAYVLGVILAVIGIALMIYSKLKENKKPEVRGLLSAPRT
jgi:nitrate reductase gamma subunit